MRIPFIANIPIEEQIELDKNVNAELMDEQERDNKIKKTYNNPNSNLRKLSDYLYNHLNQELSIKQIAANLNMKENTVKVLIGALNFYKDSNIVTVIPCPKKKIGQAGYIQSVLKDQEDYEAWDRKKRKTITSMIRVRDKASKIVSSKTKTRKKLKVIQNKSADELIDNS